MCGNDTTSHTPKAGVFLFSSSKHSEDRGLEPGTVADRYDVDVADVSRAPTYYHDNPEAMRAVERRRAKVVEGHEHLTTDPDDVRD